MKTLLAILALTISLQASTFRTWTQQESGRTIEAKMTDKTKESDKAKVVTRKGAVHWLVAKELIKEDQEYIKAWQPAVDHLTCKVVASKSGEKTIRATVRATTEAVKLEIGPEPRSNSFHTLYVPPGKFITMDFRCHPRYEATVTGMESQKVLDEEKWNRKTGL